jgi:AcrR family transcriptional regulator
MVGLDRVCSDATGTTRSRLRAVALELFLDKGFAATSVREIATNAGVTIPALYYHFDNKDGLLGDLVEGLIIDGDLANDAIAETSPVDIEGALAQYFDVVAKHLSIFRLAMSDPSVRFHDDAGHRLASQGSRFLDLLIGSSPTRQDLIAAQAALGAIRRPLRTRSIDTQADRAQILASAIAAFQARLSKSNHPVRSSDGLAPPHLGVTAGSGHHRPGSRKAGHPSGFNLPTRIPTGAYLPMD